MRTLRYAAIIIVLVLACCIILNVDVTIRQGVDGRYHDIHMPLYVKAIQFQARHYEYGRITKDITKYTKTKEEKVLAILKWTHENIKNVPPGMPLVDDHVLNIIIRSYGTSDQSQDVFTTLCAYADIPAFWVKAYNKNHTVWYPLSFVKLDSRWRVFDAYNCVYFKNGKGEVASVEDIIADKSIIKLGAVGMPAYQGTPYAEFYESLEPVREDFTLRPFKQMPFKRAVFETKRTFGLEKERPEKI